VTGFEVELDEDGVPLDEMDLAEELAAALEHAVDCEECRPEMNDIAAEVVKMFVTGSE
jgi:hypothetical protein